MYHLSTLKNGLTLITIDLPHLDSVTTLVAVKAGSRYETKKTSGISHFLEHMFFKGSKKYPSAELIARLIDGVGAVSNAGTDREFTFYWIKSAVKKIELASDILSSQIKDSLLKGMEIEREKGVIAEELRMFRDTPSRYVFDLYFKLQFGDQPLGWDIGGEEKTIASFARQDFVSYMDSFYSPEQMALVYVGKLPKDINQLAQKYFADLPARSWHEFIPVKDRHQTRPQVGLYFKQTDQVNMVLGVQGYKRTDPKRYAARLLGIMLGEGMSSRLFIQVRERRGLAYHVEAVHEPFIDCGVFVSYAGLKLEKAAEGIKLIRDEMEKLAGKKVGEEELKKAKEMERGRLALRSESTNFLATHFAVDYILDRKVETFEEYLKKIDAVAASQIQAAASELFRPERYNLQIIAPFSDKTPYEKILSS